LELSSQLSLIIELDDGSWRLQAIQPHGSFHVSQII